MKLAGNDIIDLQLASRQSNWKRKGYLQKICSEKEQQLIQSSPEPEVMLWLLWSMKEAAYKIYNRLTGIRNFAPAGLETSLQGFDRQDINGHVSVEGHCYLTKSTINPQMIHTIAVTDQSLFADLQVQISMQEDGQYPDRFSQKPQSISHHGVYLAIIYL